MMIGTYEAFTYYTIIRVDGDQATIIGSFEDEEEALDVFRTNSSYYLFPHGVSKFEFDETLAIARSSVTYISDLKKQSEL